MRLPALLGVLALTLSLAACANRLPPRNVIIEQSGDGAFTSQDFRTDGPWAMQWEVEGVGTLIMVTDLTSNSTQVVTSLPGEGYWRSDAVGPHRIQIATTGPWELRVLDLDEL